MRKFNYFILVLTLTMISCSEKSKQDQRKNVSQKKEPNALEIIHKNDCFSCHGIEEKVVGPPYLAVSRRYKNNPGIKSTLVRKIIEGGGGLWYGGMMSGHPLMEKKEVERIVDWILSLDEKRTDLIQGSVGMSLSQVFNGDTSLARSDQIKVEAFKLRNPIDNFSTHDKNIKADYKGLVNKINFMGNGSFEPIKSHYLLKFSGSLRAQLKGKYQLKLSKTGTGEALLNGKSIISNLDSDEETTLDLEAGLHSFTIYYNVTGRNDTLSFSWIPPGEAYYTLVGSE
ncbi:hypothetical protein QQ008_10900 [Fulvivirgaceae bacterium BMA10]|uniref:Cytochrome c domain-containing protein n=1 Tax=Splendidivirga corallicola TaxID=3051826 RepID=A0ABT8KMC7_9BACT|nr:hypothetical protein [Fulvivirgaceae bacterium BMA10]